MNGAESLVRTLHAAGVTTCLANPGTSEMPFVEALDRTQLMRCILGLSEGVVSGAADGYGRMRRVPAVTLLHLAPGFANAAANLHNARKAHSPVLNIVGDHTTRHVAYDAPLSADVAAAAGPFSDFVRVASSAAHLAADAADALAVAMSAPGRVATLVVPSDAAWEEGGVVVAPPAADPAAGFNSRSLRLAKAALESGEPTLLYAGGAVLESPAATALLASICTRTGATMMAPTTNRRIERGAGRAEVRRVPFALEEALATLAGFRHAVLIEAHQPVAFFGHPQRPSLVLPDSCSRIALADTHEDGIAAIRTLAEAVGAAAAVPADHARPQAPSGGRIDAPALAAAVAAALPEGVIVCDESVSAGRGIYDACAGAPPLTWLGLTGGSVGLGLPLATGAALACPDRPVLALEADGSAMYSLQALWTQAREQANVTTVILANGGYQSLKGELRRLCETPGRSALDLLDIDRPRLDFVAMATGMGVPALRVEDAGELSNAIATGLAQPGPFLIEATLA